jgi:hypothetical protein
VSGITGTQAELLYTLAAPVTKNTYAGPAIWSAPAATADVAKVPGGFFGPGNPNPVGRSLYGKAFGTIANAATGFTFLPTLELDTVAGTIGANHTTIYGATAPTASITCQFELEFWITCQQAGDAAGMTWQINGTVRQSTVAAGGVLNAAAQTGQFASNQTGLTPATTYFIELGGTWSTSSASATTTLQQMFLWGLN